MNFGRPKLTIVECEEKQSNEFDALQAIYWDSKIVDLRTKQAWKIFKPLEIQISLTPSEGESNAQMYVGIDLYIKCPPNYPIAPPYLELRNPIGLGDQQVKQFNEILKKQAQELAGEVMIHELCSHVRSFLHGHNKPPKESCHAEMMKTIKQKEKEKLDEQKKMQEEKENIEKLQAESIKLELQKKQEELKKERRRKFEMTDCKISLDVKEMKPDATTDCKALQYDDESEEEDLRISISEADTDVRLQSDYIVLEKLGHGAFGDVVKVQNLLDGRFYAIKRIPLNFHKNKTKKLTQEVKLLSRLNHKNVVRYYTSWIETSSRALQKASSSESSNFIKSSSSKDKTLESSSSDSDDSIDSLHDESIDEVTDKSSSVLFQRSNSKLGGNSEDDETCSLRSDGEESLLKSQFLYIQMEFCDKSTLRDCIDQEMYLDKQLVWSLFGEIIEGLVHIHDQGIIHRDLKPVNIFLDSQNHVKIGDFGLATVATTNLEPPSQDFSSSNRESSHNDDDSLTSNVGTALYVSPEVITSKQPYNQKVDLYSLGIIFFEMSYKPLNTGMERCKVLGLMRQSNIQFPDDFDSIVQPSQKEILLWLLDHDPSRRPSAKELLGSNLLPLLPSERNKVEKTLTSVVKSVNSHEHKVLMSTIFSQETTVAADFSYDYMITKEFNFMAAQEVSLVRQQAMAVLEKIFKRHGAISYDVPTLMPHPHKIYPDSCDEVLLMNKSGTILTLPYDSRVNFARYVRKRNIGNAKRFFVGKIYREFVIPELQPKELWECSFDIISSSPNLNMNFDAEVIMITQEILSEFPGFSDKELQLKLNHINFITAIMNYCHIPKELHHDILLVFKECKDINHQKSQLLTKFSNLGFRENDTKKFLSLLKKEDSFAGISSYLRSLPKAKDSESALIRQGLEYFQSLLAMLEASNAKFQVVLSLKLCNNFHIYSGLTFQIARRCNKKIDVLASGGSYDSLFEIFRQLDSRHHDRRHGVGVSISLDKIIFSVRSSQTLKEGKTFNPTSVELLVSSHQPKNHSMEMHVITQSLWNLGISCKLFDGHDNTLQSLKNFCKINRIPYLLIIDSQHMLIKIDSSDKDGLLHKERNFAKFTEFLKRRMKELNEQTASNKGSVDHEGSFSHLEHNNNSSYEVKLVGSSAKYKDASKVLANLGDILGKFCNCHIIIFMLEAPKELLKFILAHIKLEDEASFISSMNPVLKEYSRRKKYIQKFIDDILSKRFRNNQSPVMVLCSIEDNFYRILI